MGNKKERIGDGRKWKLKGKDGKEDEGKGQRGKGQGGKENAGERRGREMRGMRASIKSRQISMKAGK
jgi:hypothetical protein